MSTEWQSDAFRTSLVRKLEEAIRESGVHNQRPAADMENQVFRRSTNKEEYLSYVAKLILHVKQQGRVTQNPDGQNMGVINPGMQTPQQVQVQQRMMGGGLQQGPQQGLQQGPQQMQQQNRMPMQRMQVSQQQQMLMQQQQLQAQLRNRMQQPGMPGGPGNMAGGPNMPGGPNMSGGPNMAGGNMAGGNMSGGPGNMTGGPGNMSGGPGNMSGGPGSMPGGPGMQVGNMSGGPGGMQPGNMSGGPGMGPGMQGGPGMSGPGMPGGPRMSQLQQALQQRAQAGPDMQQNIRQPGMTRGMGGSGYSMRPGAPSSGPTPSSQGPSPIPYSASQSPQMSQASPHPVPSPAGGRAGSLAPSPSSQVNTPMNPANQEEREYLEKLKSLERYIEPLRGVIRKHGNEENEKLMKMKKLLDILSNPDKRVPLVTLQKCEEVLKRMQLDPADSETTDINLQANPDKNPLIDAVLKLQQNCKDGKGVSLNNSLANTFIPPVEIVLGPEISLPPLPRTPPPAEEDNSRIPDLLQGEIARLDPRFQVCLASSQPDFHSPAVDLVCQLEDKDLPAVAHLHVSIPANYPDYPPQTNMDSPKFLSTPFLQEVHASLSSRLDRMPHKFTLTQLLTAWELSVRSACPPSHIKQMYQQQTPLVNM